MERINEGRIAIVTGAGRGVGRAHALLLARTGAKVVVNDLGGEMDGSGGDVSPARQVMAEIQTLGGEAIANGDNVADWAGAQRMINMAIETFGGLDILVNNAGILRDRVLANMTEEEWDSVINVHLKGTFAPSRWAASYWRDRSKAGNPVDGRIINTTSVSGIYGNSGQSNYGAAKAGVAAFTIIISRELGRYGVTANAVGPIALTRMTANLDTHADETEEERAMRDPGWVSPIVAWLASPRSKHISGRVFEAAGSILGIAEGWRRGPYLKPEDEWLDDPALLDPIVEKLLSYAAEITPFMGGPSEYPAL